MLCYLILNKVCLIPLILASLPTEFVGGACRWSTPSILHTFGQHPPHYHCAQQPQPSPFLIVGGFYSEVASSSWEHRPSLNEKDTPTGTRVRGAGGESLHSNPCTQIPGSCDSFLGLARTQIVFLGRPSLCWLYSASEACQLRSLQASIPWLINVPIIESSQQRATPSEELGARAARAARAALSGQPCLLYHAVTLVVGSSGPMR